LTTKPALFFTPMGVLPSLRARSATASTVASEVRSPRMISTSAITGTGLKKCMPTNRSGRPVAAARRVIEIDEVLVAMIVPGEAMASTFCRILILIASFSVAASMIRSVPASESAEVLVLIRDITVSLSASVSVPLRTERSSDPDTVFSARSSAASLTSWTTAFNPATAQACAMPLPMVPAPMIPIV
jgi:hypothetical protein